MPQREGHGRASALPGDGGSARRGCGRALPPADGASVADLITLVTERHPALGPVLEVASLLLDEVTVRDRAEALPSGAQLDVLPPFAGG